MIFSVLGRIVSIEGFALMLPCITGMLYGEWKAALSFGVTAVAAVLFGLCVFA